MGSANEVRRISLVGELRRIRRYTKSGEDKHYLSWAIKSLQCQFAEQPVQKDVAELERMFRLQDPREQQ